MTRVGAIGDEAMALGRTQLDLWSRSGLSDVIEEWQQKQNERCPGFVVNN
jgi:hypothetical protein